MTEINGYKVDDNIQANKVYNGNCPYCGAPLVEGAEVCAYCGRKIKKKERRSASEEKDTFRNKVSASGTAATVKDPASEQEEERDHRSFIVGSVIFVIVLIAVCFLIFMAWVPIAIDIDDEKTEDEEMEEETEEESLSGIDTDDCHIAVTDVSGTEVTMEVENRSDEKFYFLILGQLLNGEEVDVAGDSYCTDLEPGETVSVVGKFPDEIDEAEIEYMVFKDWEDSSEDAYLAEGMIRVSGEE